MNQDSISEMLKKLCMLLCQEHSCCPLDKQLVPYCKVVLQGGRTAYLDNNFPNINTHTLRTRLKAGEGYHYA